MSRPRTTKCRRCGSEIVFIKTAGGSQMPCEPERRPCVKGGSERGTVPSGETIACTFIDKNLPEEGGKLLWAWEPHFGNCVDKGGW